jgi:hypothetical protein
MAAVIDKLAVTNPAVVKPKGKRLTQWGFEVILYL